MLATGHPAIPTGDFDFTPLLYTAIVLLGYRRTGFPFKAWMIPIAVLAGGIVDTISDGFGHSTVMTACVLTLVAILIPPRRAHAPLIPPSDV